MKLNKKVSVSKEMTSTRQCLYYDYFQKEQKVFKKFDKDILMNTELKQEKTKMTRPTLLAL